MYFSRWLSVFIIVLAYSKLIPAFPVPHDGEPHDSDDATHNIEESYDSKQSVDSESNEVHNSAISSVVIEAAAATSGSGSLNPAQDSHDHSAPMHSMAPSPASMNAHAGHHHVSGNILSDPSLEPQQRAYWEAYNATTFFSSNATIPNRPMLYSHVILTTVAWVGIFPFTMMMGVEHHRYYLAGQTLQTAVALAALFCLLVFGSTCPPDLYPNNAYSKMSVILFFWVIVHYLAVVIKELSKTALHSGPIDGAEYVLANMSAAAGLGNVGGGAASNMRSAHQGLRPSYDSSHAYQNDNDVQHTPYDYNDDFSVSAQDSAESDDVDNSSDVADEHLLRFEPHEPQYLDPESNSSPFFRKTSRIEKFQKKMLKTIMKAKYSVAVVTKFKFVADLLFVLLHRPLFLYAYTYYVTGVATAFRLAMGHSVFNLLAHLIKGSVFTVYGFLTLGRFCGAFKKKGMAWNIRPGSKYDVNENDDASGQAFKAKRYPSDTMDIPDDELNDEFMDPHRSYYSHKSSDEDSVKFFSKLGDMIPSLEFVESFLIFFYGSTNIFMEHLGHSSSAWSHKDLQHGSIAFMYIGGGLCGLLLEWKFAKRAAGVNLEEYNIRNGFSFNPIPAFIVFWTGILMSQHAQELPLSTTIHSQWGYLFVVGAIFRAFTYLMLFVSPPTSTSPSRPFTEIITSFCLICGGMVFMQSNDQTIQAMMYRGLDGMFTLNVNVGVAALIMAYIMIVMTFKGWISKDF